MYLISYNFNVMEKCQNFISLIEKCASDKERVDRLANKIFPRPLIARDQSAVENPLSHDTERDNSTVSIRASPFARYHCLNDIEETERKDEQAGGRRGTEIREEGRAL